MSFERESAFDTDRGAWLSTSDGEYTSEFDLADLRAEDIEGVLYIFWERYKGHHSFYIHRESEVLGWIVVKDPVLEPESLRMETVESKREE